MEVWKAALPLKLVKPLAHRELTLERSVASGFGLVMRRGTWCASPGCVIVQVELMGIKGAFGVPFGDRNKFRHLTPTAPTREGRSYSGAADPSDNKWGCFGRPGSPGVRSTN